MIIVLSGPSGIGKGFVKEALKEKIPILKNWYGIRPEVYDQMS